MTDYKINIKAKVDLSELHAICIVEYTNHDCKFHSKDGDYCMLKKISINDMRCVSREYEKCSNCGGDMRRYSTGLACESCHQPASAFVTHASVGGLDTSYE